MYPRVSQVGYKNKMKIIVVYAILKTAALPVIAAAS